MERLTKRIPNAEGKNIVVFTKGEYEDTTAGEMTGSDKIVLRTLANYEDLEEQGLLLKLPCKVGDTVYYISETIEKHGRKKVSVPIVDKGIVDNITFGSTMIPQITVCNNENIWTTFDSVEDFNKTVFLTQAEAEEALKRTNRGERMSIKPILFNTDMVRAILGGKKTVTRRIVKHNIATILNSPYHKAEVPDKVLIEKLCRPPYQPGDILYVRETFTTHWVPDEEGKPQLEYCYKADDIDIEAECLPGENNRWYPSIHMPKEAARIWLKVTNVRVEQLQEMTASESAKEGIQLPKEYDTRERSYILGFTDLWDSTIKKSDFNRYRWNANPWVWVIEFERCDKPKGQEEKTV